MTEHTHGQAVESQGSAEALLVALKHALVDAAQEQTVNVISSAYINNRGELIESTYFDTQATISGVRVLEYLPAPETVAAAPAVTLPASLQNARQGVCAINAPTHYRPTLLVSARTDIGQGRVSDADTNLIKHNARTLLNTRITLSGDWIPVHEDELAVGLSQYERLLTGLSPFEEMDYELRWSLSKSPPAAREGLIQRLAHQGTSAINAASKYTNAAARHLAATNPIAPINLPASNSPATFYHQLELISRRSGDTLHAQYFEVTLPRSTSLLRRNQPSLAADLINPLGLQLDEFFAELARDFGCQFRQFAVIPDATIEMSGQISQLQISIGSANNVTLGDRFLIIETPWEGGQQTLNTNLVGSLSIGEIVRVDEFRSTLKLIAGNGTPRDLNFALPF